MWVERLRHLLGEIERIIYIGVGGCCTISSFAPRLLSRVRNWALKFGVDLWEFGRQFTKMNEIKNVSICQAVEEEEEVAIKKFCDGF